MKKPVTKTFLLCLVAAFLFTGCADDKGKTTAATQPTVAAPAQPAAEAAKPAAEAPKADNSYTGRIVGISEKSKTISIAVGPEGKAETFMVKFNEKTAGVNKIKKDDAAVITFEAQGNDKVAVSVTPKLAKLPEGVSEIKTAEMKKMVDSKTKMVLADARPVLRYNQGHLPGSINTPVDVFKEKAAEILPPEKDIPIVFYCGGPT